MSEKLILYINCLCAGCSTPRETCLPVTQPPASRSPDVKLLEHAFDSADQSLVRSRVEKLFQDMQRRHEEQIQELIKANSSLEQVRKDFNTYIARQNVHKILDIFQKYMNILHVLITKNHIRDIKRKDSMTYYNVSNCVQVHKALTIL